MTTPSGSAMWSARRIASPAAAWSPSASRAIASSRQASAARSPGRRVRRRRGPERARRSPRAGRPGRSAAPPGPSVSRRWPALLADFRDVLLGPPGFTQPHQGVQPQRAGPHQRPVRCVKQPGQPLSSLESGQHLLVAATRQLQQRAHIADHDRRHGVGFRPEGALGALHPNRCLLELSPPDRPGREPYCRRCRRQARRSSRAAGPVRSSAGRALPPARRAMTARWRSTCGGPGRGTPGTAGRSSAPARCPGPGAVPPPRDGHPSTR